MNEIKQMTVSDSTMQILKNYITHGHRQLKALKNEIKHYFNHRIQLVQFHNIVLKGEYVVIPAQLRTNILEKIHAGHQGYEKCKRRARLSGFFWGGGLVYIERIV